MGWCCKKLTWLSFPETDAVASSVLRARRPRKWTSHSPSQRLAGVLLIIESGLESKSLGSLHLLISQMGRRRRQWHPTPVLLPGKSHGWRSPVGCSPWGRWESDTTERLHFHFSLTCTGEGNGNPLQCSCLENPRDGGAWWAAIYGVTQSRTRLKQLSSSSSYDIRLELTDSIKFILILSSPDNAQNSFPRFLSFNKP